MLQVFSNLLLINKKEQSFHLFNFCTRNKFRNDSQAYQFYHHNINQSNKYLLIRSFKISLHNMCLSRHILYFY
ncbi:hypothetical protein PFTANZ_06581 [Plasmodium falciparum Tanzania (2000708)]|uniref:Uncharacterized protein n=1 Tax=Plasmodium falciparum Tanzania (2000708) TaxID=1036725 RepID=A0A024VWK2_PLAFA|nr:hypothetical protein PFTANZ_06581 [Plasmodium falciparum Tanzania (2000708)]